MGPGHWVFGRFHLGMGQKQDTLVTRLAEQGLLALPIHPLKLSGFGFDGGEHGSRQRQGL